MKNRTLKIVLMIITVISLFLLILSSSIFFTTVSRWLYYIDIEKMKLNQEVFKHAGENGTLGTLNNVQIHQIYSNVMDFLQNKTSNFNIAPLGYTNEGLSHFEDVKKLFNICLGIFITSLVLSIACIIWGKWKFKKDFPIISLGAYASISLIVVFLIVLIIALIDYNIVFNGFHKMFFPGKTNWNFDEDYDEIIKLLPQEVFVNYSIMFFVLLSVFTLSFIIPYIIRIIKKHIKARKEKLQQAC
ncbi:TIGR01906 family membrane protein [Mycoplasma sp. VS30B]